MSLINKMLQDLDARGSHAGAAMPGEIRPVMVAERRLPVLQIALAGTVLIIGLGVAGYFWLKGRAPGAPTAAVVALAPPRPVAVAASHAPTPTLTPTAPAAAAPVAMPAPVPTHALAPAPAPAPAPAHAQAGHAEVVNDAHANAATPALRTAPAVRVMEPDRLREAALAQPRPASAAVPLAGERDMTNIQRAESMYRQSLGALDDGRLSTAVDGMEQALKLNPRHDAARQSLVGLLIEAGRKDEAMQQLEQGLAADPSQAQLAMLLARMQIERGISGVATLQRTLPAAQNNGEYRAFLAGALQREQRHREAAEQYAAALRGTPEQGVWLMGLGISLQADKRDAEALTAFQRAKVSGMLTPALMTFVQGRIDQLRAQ